MRFNTNFWSFGSGYFPGATLYVISVAPDRIWKWGAPVRHETL